MANVDILEPTNNAAVGSVIRAARNHATGLGHMDAAPTADVTTRGALHFVPGATSVADQIIVPLKTAADTYENRTLLLEAPASGATVFNEAGADVDFRVESDGNANALFIDGGNNRVGIFTAAPTVPLDVTGASLFTGAMTIDGGAFVFNEASADHDLRVESNGNTHAVFVDASTDRVGVFTAAPTVPFEVTGNSLFTGTVTTTGAVSVPSSITSQRAGGTTNVFAEGFSADANGPIFTGRKSRHATLGSQTVVQQGDQTFSLLGMGSDGTTYRNSAQILMAVDSATISSTSMPGRIVFATSGVSSVSPTERVRIDNLGTMTLAAGSTAHAPLKLTAGTNLTTPVAGAFEYDGNCLYFDPAASHRGLVPARLLARVDSATALVGDTSAQAMFASGNDALTVIAGATYRFRVVARLTTGATSASVSFLFGGTATFTTVNYVSHGISAASGTAAASSMNNGEAATAVIVVPDGTGVNKRFMIEGEFEIANAGTLIPQVQFSADPQGDETVNVGSFFECWRIGANPVTSIGLWA